MIDKELLIHVRTQKINGLSDEKIKQELANKNLEETEIDHVIQLAEALNKEAANTKNPFISNNLSQKKNILQKEVTMDFLGPFITGFAIGQGIFFGLSTIILYLIASKIITLPTGLNHLPWYFSTLGAMILIIAISVVFTFYSYVKNNWWWEIFIPSSGRILASTFLFCFSLFIIFALKALIVQSGDISLLPFSFLISFLMNSANIFYVPLNLPFFLTTALNILINFLLFYTFCMLVRALTDRELRSKIIIVILLLLLINPYTVSSANFAMQIGSFVSKINQNIYKQQSQPTKNQYKCGTLVLSTNPGGPADLAGIKPQMIINKIDNTPVTELSQYMEYWRSVKSVKSVVLHTNKGDFFATYKKLPNSTTYDLGLQTVDQAYCNKN